MTVILVLVYIGLTRLGWTTRIIFITAVNAGATILMFDYIDSQFDVIREVFEEYYKRYD